MSDDRLGQILPSSSMHFGRVPFVHRLLVTWKLLITWVIGTDEIGLKITENRKQSLLPTTRRGNPEAEGHMTVESHEYLWILEAVKKQWKKGTCIPGIGLLFFKNFNVHSLA